MDLLESFATAAESLSNNKMRAILTMLGIIIGVAAVITLLALGNGVSESIQDQVEGLGSNLITIITDYDNSDGYPALGTGDIATIEDQLYAPAIRRVAAEVQGTQQVLYSGRDTRVTVSGITANYFDVRNKNVEYGGSLTEDDVNSKARVAVIGSGVVEDLYPNDEFPVGTSVRIRGIQYKVIGVMEEQGGMGMMNEDTNIYIPISTAQTRLYTRRTRAGDRKADIIFAEAIDESRMDEGTDQIKAILRSRHDIAYSADDDFTIISQTDILDAFGVIMNSVSLFLGAIAGISLLVGGIGIMNIMLVSVTERTREIGIRKAVGAQKRDVLIQFLIESLMLSMVGGLLGVILGFVAANVIGSLTPDLTPVVDIGTVTMSFSFAAAVGLIFGIYPAWRAAGLRPIEALRYE